MAFTRHTEPTAAYIRIGEIDSWYEVVDPLDLNEVDLDPSLVDKYPVDIVESIAPGTKGNKYVVVGDGFMVLLDDLKELVKLAEERFK